MSNGFASQADTVTRQALGPPSAARGVTHGGRFSREDKILLGLFATAVVGIIVIAGLSSRKKPKKVKKNYGIVVNEQCNSFEVTDEGLVQSEIQRLIDEELKLGPVDPFMISREFLDRAAPHCRKYPDEVRNPGEAGLYVMTFNTVVVLMQEQQLLSQAQVNTFKAMMQTWAMSQGVPASEF